MGSGCEDGIHHRIKYTDEGYKCIGCGSAMIVVDKKWYEEFKDHMITVPDPTGFYRRMGAAYQRIMGDDGSG